MLPSLRSDPLLQCPTAYGKGAYSPLPAIDNNTAAGVSCTTPFRPTTPRPSVEARATYRLNGLLLDVTNEAMANLGIDQVREEKDYVGGGGYKCE